MISEFARQCIHGVLAGSIFLGSITTANVMFDFSKPIEQPKKLKPIEHKSKYDGWDGCWIDSKTHIKLCWSPHT